MTENTLNITKLEEDKSDLPKLPQCHNPALNFWAVFLEDFDGTQYKGPTMAIPHWVKRPYVEDTENPRDTLKVTYATTGREFAIMEQGAPLITAKHANGRDKMRLTREWVDADARHKKYYEDKQVASTRTKPFVRATMLYCPVFGAAAGGGIERHGVYLGLEEADVANRPDYFGKPGYCPKCNHDPDEEAKALREIRELYKRSGVAEPQAVTEAYRKAKVEGRIQ